MKSKLITLQLCLILFFGLISCSPDKTKEQKPNRHPVDVEIKNSDSTYQKISETKSLNINSSISLRLEEFPLSETVTLAKVDCRTSFIKEALSKESIFKGSSELSVKNILPIEAYTPHSNAKTEVICDFLIESFLNEKKLAITRLNKVEIRNIKDFNNFDDPTLRFNENKRFNRSEITELVMDLPSNDGEIETLCEKGRAFNFIKENKISFSDLFEESLFVENIEHCRLVISDKKSQNIWLSSDFYVQNKQPSLEFISFENFMETKEKNDLAQKTLLRVTYRNPNDFKVFFRFTPLDTSITILPIYNAPLRGNEIGNAGTPINIGGTWSLIDPVAMQEQPSSDDILYKLMPGQKMILELSSNHKLTCVISQSNLDIKDPEHQSRCHQSILISGMLFYVGKYPLIGLNRFTDLKKIDFIDFTSYLQSAPIYNEFNLWAPYRDIKDYCIKKPITEHLVGPLVRMDLKNPQFFNCQAH